MRVWVLTPHVVSTNTVMQVTSLLRVKDESPGFSDINLKGYPGTSLQPCKCGSLAFSLIFCWHVWRWYLAGVEKLLSKGLLPCSAAFLLLRWLWRPSFYWSSYRLCLLPFPSCWFLQLQSWNIKAKRKPRDLTTVSSLIS